jgi:hypothetical protein
MGMRCEHLYLPQQYSLTSFQAAELAVVEPAEVSVDSLWKARLAAEGGT